MLPAGQTLLLVSGTGQVLKGPQSGKLAGSDLRATLGPRWGHAGAGAA